ncbi:MAG: carboxylesterase, partial [Mesorhizobium sp.]
MTVDNFVRAETDLYFSNSVKGGGFGGWHHVRDLLPIDHQTVIRGNRDT